MRLCCIILSPRSKHNSKKYKRLMNIKAKKLSYVAPVVELIHVSRSLNLLVSISVESGLQEWEEGAEL